MKAISENSILNLKMFETKFNIIFCNKELNDLLKKIVGSFDLWYICMNFLIEKNDSVIEKKIPTIFRSESAILYLNKFFYKIMPLFKSWINPILKNKSQHRNLDVLFISRDRFIEVDDENSIYKSDYLFSSIIQEMVKSHNSMKIALLCNTDPPQGMNIAGYNVYRFIRPLDFFKSLYLSLKIIIQWKIIKTSKPVFGKNGSNSDIPYLNINAFFSFRILFCRFLKDYAYTFAFNSFNPKIIVANDDLMQFKPKSNNKLQFITLQSARLSPINETYRRYFSNKFGSDVDKSDYFICPGEYYKELKEYSCVSKKVVVMGQPRYDTFTHADEIYDRIKITRDLGLDPTKKIILWCTQTHGQSLDENRSSINAVYNVISSLKEDVQLIIKLHPEEEQDAPLYNENTHYKPLILKRDMDTNALLYSCDLMITKNSTTAMEAVILNKPVIVLNLGGDPDRVNYVSEGVALGVYDPADLSFAVEKILDDNSILHENREDYIKKYLYKVDGKATERVVDLILSLLDESKS